jgi:hypothetical protein
MHRLHPTPTARLAIYSLFAFLLAAQVFFWPAQPSAIPSYPSPLLAAVAIFCLAFSIFLGLAALYSSFVTPAPLTQAPPPSKRAALTELLVVTVLAPFHYTVFYFALFVLALTVTIPVHLFSFSDFWTSLLVLFVLGACFLLEYAFLYLLTAAAENLPEPLQLPADQSAPI